MGLQISTICSGARGEAAYGHDQPEGADLPRGHSSRDSTQLLRASNRQGARRTMKTFMAAHPEFMAFVSGQERALTCKLCRGTRQRRSMPLLSSIPPVWSAP